MKPHLRILLISVVFPALVALAGAAVAATWLPDLPAEVAVHWGTDGPDGFASPWLLVLLPVVISLPFTGVAVGASWRGTPSGRPSVTQKILLAVSTGLAVLLVIGVHGSLFIQRGIEDAAAAPSVAGPLLIGLAAGLASGALAWLLLPPADRSRAPGVPAEPLDLPATAAVYWSRTIAFAPRVWVFLGAVIGVLLVVIVLLVRLAPAAVAIAAVVAVTVSVLALLTGAWRVTADRRGLSVRGILGVPVIRVPADDIAAVRVVRVDPTADFGGWGIRSAPGRGIGIVLRAGDAVEVTRRSGRILTVTVDDAPTAAAVLATLTPDPAKTP